MTPAPHPKVLGRGSLSSEAAGTGNQRLGEGKKKTIASAGVRFPQEKGTGTFGKRIQLFSRSEALRKILPASVLWFWSSPVGLLPTPKPQEARPSYAAGRGDLLSCAREGGGGLQPAPCLQTWACSISPAGWEERPKPKGLSWTELPGSLDQLLGGTGGRAAARRWPRLLP